MDDPVKNCIMNQLVVQYTAGSITRIQRNAELEVVKEAPAEDEEDSLSEFEKENIERLFVRELQKRRESLRKLIGTQEENENFVGIDEYNEPVHKQVKNRTKEENNAGIIKSRNARQIVPNKSGSTGDSMRRALEAANHITESTEEANSAYAAYLPASRSLPPFPPDEFGREIIASSNKAAGGQSPVLRKVRHRRTISACTDWDTLRRLIAPLYAT